MEKKYLILISLCVIVIAAGLSAVYISGNKVFTQESVPSAKQSNASELRLLKEKWRTQIEAMGGEKAYAAFLEEVSTLSLEPHSQAHAFGEALYEAEGLSGLKACDSSFEFGCYHSFLGIAVHNEGIETLPKFAEACKDKYGVFNLPCEHGIGHGVLVYTDYDNLEEALELCETINKLPTGGCSSGVFMEYNFHTMDENSPYLRELGDNLYEPCDTLPDRFQASCYFEQVQWWLQLYNGDFNKIAELCAAFPKDSYLYETCYNGIGNYAAGWAHDDVEGIVEHCKKMPDAVTNGLCHEGATWVLRIYPEKMEDARRLCELLQEPYQAQCFRRLESPS